VTACTAFEDRLIDYDELLSEERADVDTHLQGCPSCREYLSVLREIDAALSVQVRAVHLNPHRVAAIRESVAHAEPIGRISRLPEWLDFVAAGALLAFAGGLVWQAGVFAAVVNALSLSP
jgi:anti-sigma factor RsiW